jgi:hypothetical protein
MSVIKGILVLSVGGFISLCLYLSLNQKVLFESIESKNEKGESIYNQVEFISGKDKDVWLMRQGQKGLDQPLSGWDELKVTVDKTQKPFRATFSQLKEGKEIEYKVSCFICHPNGLRKIRAQLLDNNTWRDRLTLSYWNLKMASYGRILPVENLINNKNRKRSLYLGKTAGTKLKVKVCFQCHGDKNGFDRGELFLQNAVTIAHLVEKKEMPPFGHSLSEKEKAEILTFLTTPPLHKTFE